MPLIRPFAGLRPDPAHAAEVLAPPYDVLSAAEARSLAAGHPWSFLHVSRPEIDFAEGTDPYAPEVYVKGAESLQRLREEGVLRQDPIECLYLYRLSLGEHVQSGVVAAASVSAYEDGRIRRHELTRAAKEDDRARHIDTLGAQTGPVLLTYRHRPALDALVAELAAGVPDVDTMAADGVRHTLWVVRDPSAIDALGTGFETLPRVYIADGHHRSAAACRVARWRRAGSPGAPAGAAYERFLAVLFPDTQMRILDYNRVVTDLGGLDAQGLLDRLLGRFVVRGSSGPVRPAATGELGMYLAGRWYRLLIRPQWVPRDDAVEALDVSLLGRHLLEPILGIADARRDPRVDFVGGVRGLGELERRVDSGEAAVAFALYPTPIEMLMAVADAGGIMPPKSTWFEPKLADGLVSLLID